MQKIFCIFLVAQLAIGQTYAQTEPDNNRVLTYFQNQQFSEAIAYLKPFFTADTNSRLVLGFLGYASYMNENMVASEKYFRRVYALDTLNTTAIHYLAVITGNTSAETGKKWVRQLISLQPGKAINHRHLAELFRRTNQRDSALDQYNTAYEMDSLDDKTAIGLADLLLDQKKNGRADSIIKSGLSRDSANLSLVKLLIRSAYETQHYAVVTAAGETLMRLEELSVNALSQVALSYYNLMQYQDCIRVCEYMTGHGLTLESIYYYEAKAWARLKEFGKSNALLDICLANALSKSAELYYYSLGQNHEALGRFSNAVCDYDTAYYLFRDPLMKYYCGRICELRLKDEKKALRYYTAYLAKAHPASADEKKAYAYVKERWGRRKKPSLTR